MTIAEYLRKELIFLDAPWKTREEVFSGLCQALADNGLIQDAQACTEKLIEREKLSSTATGDGVAIPHAHIDEGELCVAFARTAAPVDCNAMDGQPCRIFFLVLAPDAKNELYLRVLASIARLARSARFRDKVLKAQTADEVLEIIGTA